MWSGLLAYLAFTTISIIGPGLALQRAAGVRADWSLVVPLGGAASAGAYWISAVLGLPWLYPASIAVLSLPLLRRGRQDGPPAEPAPSPAPLLAVLAALLAVTVYPLHRLDANGDFLLEPERALAADTAFHVGVTRELTLGYPPQVPGLAGVPLSYHLGIDLVRAAALRWAGVDPYHSINRFDVTLWAFALALSVRAAARAIGAPPVAIGLAGFTLVAGDFSFLFAGNPQAHWWTDLLRGNIVLSLLFANPVVPALSMALGAVVALAHYAADRRRGWLALSLGLAFAVAFFKVFLGAHLALGLGAAALLRRDRGHAAAAAAALLSTALLASNTAGQSVAVTFAPLDLVNVTRETLALERLSGPALGAWGLLWLAASLGVRLLGVAPAIGALRSGPPAAVALATVALSGWPLGLLFKVAPPDAVAGQKPINDAAFLVEQSGPLLWIFTAIALSRIRLRTAAVVLAALLAVPSTVQLVVKKALTPPDRVPAVIIRAMDVLAAHTAPGELVLQRPSARYPPPPVVWIGRRVLYERFTPYLTQFAPVGPLETRHVQVNRLFERITDAEEAAALADTLGARYLCLYPHDPRPRFDVSRVYEPVFEEGGMRVLRRR